MKKLMLLFGMLIFIALGTVSCSDDDDGSSDTNYEHVIGKWKTKHLLTAGVQTTPTSCEEFVQYRFKNDGTYEKTTYTGELDSTNDPEGEDCLEDAIINGVWSYQGNDRYLIHDNNVTITDENESSYTFVLTTQYNNTELHWFTLSDYENSVNTKVVFQRQ